MNRSLIVILTIIFLILATAMTLGAQGRGHFGGSRSFSGTPVVRPGPPVVARPPVGAAPFRGAVNGFRPFRPARPLVVAPVVSYYSPYYWPAPVYGYGSAYPAYSASGYYDQGYAYPDNTAAPVAGNQNEVDLAYQVGQLSAQVAQLQQQQQQAITTYTQPVSPSQRPAQSTSTPTVLVFRDGRRMEIQNYAMIGQTLWVLDERVATKIPLSDLDLDATQKENHSLGVRFLAPEK